MSGQQFEKLLAEEISYHGEQLRKDLSKPVTGFTFAELLVICIIRANPLPSESDRQRLIDAMYTLFGRKIAPEDPADEHALRVMATWWAMDREPGTTKKRRSIEKLAEEATRLEKLGSKEETAIERRRKAFSEKRPALLASIGDFPESIDVLQRFALDDLEELLTQLGVRFMVDH